MGQTVTDPADAVALSLSELTAGWRPAPGVDPTTLSTARLALARSLMAAGPTLPLRIPPPVAETTVTTPVSSAELARIAQQAHAAGTPRVIAAIRSPGLIGPANPTGAPAWARAGKVLDSYGPFQDSGGGLHWVDLLRMTTSVQVEFAGAAEPIAVMPVTALVRHPPPGKQLELGPGSVWLLASLFGASFQAGAFTGFTISGGTLAGTQPFSNQNGRYVAPAGTTLTLTVTLAQDSSASSTGGSPDAAAATVSPPAQLVIQLTASTAVLHEVGGSRATAYGTSVDLEWTGGTPTLGGEPEAFLIPCTASLPDFTFTQVRSTAFTPAGTAPVTLAAWMFPITTATITDLPEAAGPGSAGIGLGKGAAVATELLPDPIAVARWIVEITTGGLLVGAFSAGPTRSTTLTLWPEVSPPGRSSTLEFSADSGSVFLLVGTTTFEWTYVSGSLVAHLDRPLDSSGARIPFNARGSAATMVLHGQASTLAQITATQVTTLLPAISLALENALVGTVAPSQLTASGALTGTRLGPCQLAESFGINWILPTLPDPYTTTQDTPVGRDDDIAGRLGTLLATVNWDGSNPPQMSCSLQTADAGVTPSLVLAPRATAAPAPLDNGMYRTALLDLSTNADLLGVAISPTLGNIALHSLGNDARSNAELIADTGAGTRAQAPEFGLAGMSLVFNSADVAAFALPQVSWEAVDSATFPNGPISGPDTDGTPLLVAVPDSQQLVQLAPQPVLANSIANVAAGAPFAAIFTLPFGLSALIAEPNGPPGASIRRRRPPQAQFLAAGGTFTSHRPVFRPGSPGQLTGAEALTIAPTATSATGGADPVFHGFLWPQDPYLTEILGRTPDDASTVEQILTSEFGCNGQGVPLERIDFSGYGASIFSEWLNGPGTGPMIIKVQFETSRGRTAFEVIQAQSVIYPYVIKVVRTITLQRRNAGWVLRTDSGWQAASSGKFQFPAGATMDVHQGALLGMFNVRNIAETGPEIAQVNFPTYQGVLFDADIGVAGSVDVNTGGFTATPAGENEPITLAPSRNVLGFVQLHPVDTPPTAEQLAELVATQGPFTPAVSITAEIGKFGAGTAGTVMRCSAFEVGLVTGNNALGVALRGAPQIPRVGGWSMGVRNYQNQAPSSLPDNFPVPLVQNNTDTSLWHIADIADIGSLQQPANLYSLIHATGTNKVMFEAPQIPAVAGAAGTPIPGLQFPPITNPLPGGVVTPGSPYLGDLASILNSSGLFPGLNSALSVFDNELAQIKTIPDGIQYSKNYTFKPDASGQLQQTPIVDLGVISIVLVYGDTTQPKPKPAVLKYQVDSTKSPSWSLSLGPLSAQVTVPAFSKDDPVLTITGTFYADEHTKPGLTHLNISYGSALDLVKQVFSDLQALAAYLPGGIGAGLDVSVSGGHLTVRDSFNIADLPLGLGNLTDISLDLGMEVTLAPTSVNFLIGLGAPKNPFNWIATPLAGNGLMNLGVQDSLPAFIIQAGLGLGCAIDLAIATGSASITLAVELDVSKSSIELVATLTGKASVDVLDGLISLAITLSAALGFSLDPIPTPIPQLDPPGVTIPQTTITLLASCSVGIHVSVAWVVNVSWDGSWEFQQSFTTPKLAVTL